VFTTGGAFNPQPKFELRRIPLLLVSVIKENRTEERIGYRKRDKEEKEKILALLNLL
jgi:hypothetical protein